MSKSSQLQIDLLLCGQGFLAKSRLDLRTLCCQAFAVQHGGIVELWKGGRQDFGDRTILGLLRERRYAFT